jgi:hypothetical protein
MPKVEAFHTNHPEDDPPKHRDVYHDNSECKDGKRIKPEHRRRSTDNRPRCDECDRLELEGR